MHMGVLRVESYRLLSEKYQKNRTNPHALYGFTWAFRTYQTETHSTAPHIADVLTFAPGTAA